MKTAVILLVLAAAPLASFAEIRFATDEAGQAGANPVRKVVSLLQKMAKTVEKEAEEEQELFDKFNCWCKTGGAELQQSISSNTAKVPSLQSDIEEAESEVVRLKEELKQHQVDRTAAKGAMTEATTMREKDTAAYQAESGELKGYISALNGAIPAIEKGMAGTRLLQAGTAAAMLRTAASSSTELTDFDRQSVLAFLSGTEVAGYVPKGGEVVGILKNMLENYDKDLAAVETSEAEAVKLYEKLMAAKTKQIEALGASIEKKTARVGELGVSIVTMKNDLSDSEASLVADKKFLDNLTSDCEAKQAERDERVKTRAEELVAIHETIKILNDDDALELFKKTLPSPSLLQLRATSEEQARAKALAVLHRGNMPKHAGGADVRFLEMALNGKKVDFSKVVKMIDQMIAILDEEQQDDSTKLEYCNTQIDSAEDKVKELKKNIDDLQASIEERTETLATIKDELKALHSSIAELDKAVQEATEQRKQENAEFSELMSNDSAAKELLGFAKNRLNKFYNPKLYKAPPKRELSEEEKISTSMGGESFLQLEAHDAPADKPSTWEGDYQKKGEQTTGVIAMIDLLVRDLDKEMTEAQTQERAAQKEYEQLMDDSAEKRAKDVASIGTKETAKANNEELMVQEQADSTATTAELMATKKYEQQLHAECDWLMQNFDLRQSARAQERDNLKEAKAVLSGADFSLLQASSRPQAGLLSRRRVA